MPNKHILVMRLGAMGDILHALPAVAALHSIDPETRITWAVERKWTPLLQHNSTVDAVSIIDRSTLSALRASIKSLRQNRYDLAIDFQGLYKSAFLGLLTRPTEFIGFHHSQIREPLAARLYTRQIKATATHVVDRNLELAAFAGAPHATQFIIPPGEPEGELPSGPFVLASPFAGWASKQWPIHHFSSLAALLKQKFNIPLVLNAPPDANLRDLPNTIHHISSLPGLIHATRQATAVVGVDSGPLHLAAALDKPGVAIFGPTDPARNGPYTKFITVLRDPNALTTYKRKAATDPSMLAITPEQVVAALTPHLQ